MGGGKDEGELKLQKSRGGFLVHQNRSVKGSHADESASKAKIPSNDGPGLEKGKGNVKGNRQGWECQPALIRKALRGQEIERSPNAAKKKERPPDGTLQAPKGGLYGKEFTAYDRERA